MLRLIYFLRHYNHQKSQIFPKDPYEPHDFLILTQITDNK